MLLSLGEEHRKHLQIFASHSGQVVIDFCKLALDYLQNGYNLRRYNIAAQKLEVSPEYVQNVVDGLVYLLIDACKYRLTEDELKKSLEAAQFSDEHQSVFVQFYNAKKQDVSNVLIHLGLRLPTYQDLQWRFEVQLATSVSEDVRPSVTMDLILKTLRAPPYVGSIVETAEAAATSSDQRLQKLTAEGDILNQQNVRTASELTHNVEHVFLQCDLPNLVNLVTSLEGALLESKTYHVKRMRRAFKKKQ